MLSMNYVGAVLLTTAGRIAVVVVLALSLIFLRRLVRSAREFKRCYEHWKAGACETSVDGEKEEDF